MRNTKTIYEQLGGTYQEGNGSLVHDVELPDQKPIGNQHYQKIMKRIRQLADFPEIGAPLSSIISLEVPYRFLVCGNYTAFYKVEGDEVHIIRVLYGRRNFMQILFGKSYDE